MHPTMLTINNQLIENPSQALALIHAQYPNDWSDLAVLAVLPYPDSATLHRLWTRHKATDIRKRELAQRYSFVTEQARMSDSMRIAFTEILRNQHNQALIFLVTKAADHLRPRWQLANHGTRTIDQRVQDHSWQRLTQTYLNALSYARPNDFSSDLLNAFIPGLLFDCDFACQLLEQFQPFQEQRFAQSPHALSLLHKLAQLFDDTANSATALGDLIEHAENAQPAVTRETLFMLHLMLAQHLLDDHSPFQAAKALDRAAPYFTEEARLRFEYGMVLDAIEEADDLEFDDSALQDATPAEKEILLEHDRSRALMHFNQKEYDTAYQLLRRIIELDPGNSFDTILLASICALRNQAELACDWLKQAIALDAGAVGDLDDNPDFDAIRDAPCFVALINQA